MRWAETEAFPSGGTETRQTKENPRLDVTGGGDEETIRAVGLHRAEIDQRHRRTVAFTQHDIEEQMFSIRAEQPGVVTIRNGLWTLLKAIWPRLAADTLVIVQHRGRVTAEYLEVHSFISILGHTSQNRGRSRT